MRSREGLTLIEVLLTIALFSLIIAIGVNFLIFGNRVQSMAIDESQSQARTRLISEYINNITRYATKTHTIPRSSFQYEEDGVRDPITSYIGVTKNGHVVIDEPGKNEGDDRRVQYLVEKQEGIDYEIIFEKVYGEDGQVLENVLRFSIYGTKNGKKVKEIASNMEVMNSYQIEHLGTEDDPAVALAFSRIDPGNQQWIETTPDAYISLVLDVSGSMGDDLGNSTRLEILKEKASKMINRLSSLDFNVFVALVPFSNNANSVTDFYNLNDPSEKATVLDTIDKLKADGATNTGDGIRRGYYKLRNEIDDIIDKNPEKNHSNFTQHMMVLIDGETNRKTGRITKISYEWYDFFRLFPIIASTSITDSDVDVSNELKVGKIYSVGVNSNDNAYVVEIGNKLKAYTHDDKQIINTFLIGFTADGTNSLQTIGEAINAKKYPHGNIEKPFILAENADELDFAFEQFSEEVNNNLWLITRPQLWPEE